jgi:DNA-binding transcriptional LysR family regulator
MVRLIRGTGSEARKAKAEAIRFLARGSWYFRNNGKPKLPADLRHHKGLLYSYVDDRQAWQFTGSPSVSMQSDFSCNNGDVLREMAASGCGLAYLPTFIIHRAVEEGRLETCLMDYSREAIGLHASQKNVMRGLDPRNHLSLQDRRAPRDPASQRKLPAIPTIWPSRPLKP